MTKDPQGTGKAARPGRNQSTISASEAKNSWHAVLERVSQGKERILVTRYGKPLALLCPFEKEEGKGEGLFGWLSGSVTVHGDIISPLEEEWKANA